MEYLLVGGHGVAQAVPGHARARGEGVLELGGAERAVAVAVAALEQPREELLAAVRQLGRAARAHLDAATQAPLHHSPMHSSYTTFRYY